MSSGSLGTFTNPDLLDIILLQCFSDEFEDCRVRWRDLQRLGHVSRAFVKPARKACLNRLYITSVPSLKSLCYRVLPLFGGVHVRFLMVNLVREAFRGRDRLGILFQDLIPLLSQCTMLRYLQADPCWHADELDYFPSAAFQTIQSLEHLSQLILCDPCCLGFLEGLPDVPIPARLTHLRLDIILPDERSSEHLQQLARAMVKLPAACPELQVLIISDNGSATRQLMPLLHEFLANAPRSFRKLALSADDFADHPHSLHFSLSTPSSPTKTISFRYISTAKAFLHTPDAEMFDTYEVLPLTNQESSTYLRLLQSGWRSETRTFTLLSDFVFTEFQLEVARQAAELRGMTVVHNDPGIQLEELY